MDKVRVSTIAIVVVNVFMALVAATDPVIYMNNDEQLELLLEEEGLYEFRAHTKMVNRNTSDKKTTEFKEKSELPPNRKSEPLLTSVHMEELAFVEEEELLLPTNEELRHRRRKRQVIPETEGSGVNIDEGVETSMILDATFSTADAAAAKTAAEQLVLAEYTKAEVVHESLTVTTTSTSDQKIQLTFVTKFAVANKRVSVAYVFKNNLRKKTVNGFSQIGIPLIQNSVGTSMTVSCFLCPADRPCVGDVCTASSTARSADLFAWGHSTYDLKLQHKSDVLSGQVALPVDVIIGSQAQKYMFIGDNGILSFSTTASGSGLNPSDLTDVTLDNIICVFCADADMSKAATSSEIFYGVYDLATDDSNAINIIRRATSEVQAVNSEFEAGSAIVVTWYDMPFFVSLDTSVPSTERILYQAVVITNGIQSYVMFNFKDMKWPMAYQEKALTGFQNLDTTILKSYLLPKTNGDQRSTTSLDNLFGNTGQNGIFLLKIGEIAYTVGDERDAALNCMSWYLTNVDLKSEFDAQTLAMPKCPCSKAHAQNSLKFENVGTSGEITCYDLSRNGKRDDSMRCCYRDTHLDVEESRYLRYRRHFSQQAVEDVKSFDGCCKKSGRCSLFRDLRPIQKCSGTPSETQGGGLGDPHLWTFDGYQYSFNGHGEYVLAEMPQEGSRLAVSIQGRAVPLTTSAGAETKATVFEAIAGQIKDGSTVAGYFFVELNYNKTALVIFANALDITSEFYRSDDFYGSYDNLVVTRIGVNKAIFKFFNPVVGVTVEIGVKSLSLAVSLDTDYRGIPKGLLGNFDKNANNDLVSRNGDIVSWDASDRLKYPFGESWRVTESTSIMRYSGTQTYSTMNVPNFEPLFFDEIDEAFKTSALTVCKSANAIQCIYDFIATGDSSLAENTNTVQEEATQTQAVLANGAPVLVGASSIQVETGVAFSGLEFTATDPDGDTTTFKTVFSPGSGFSLGSNGKAIWTPADSNPVRIVVVAEDDKGLASEPIDVQVTLCEGCGANGNCNYETTRPSTDALDTFRLASCDCDIGYGGLDCSEDLDGCVTRPCGSQRNCTDVNPATQASTGDAYTCGDCPTGYKSDATGIKCEDIVECDTQDICRDTATCENTLGSYICNCNPGYRKLDDGTCADIDECADKTDNCTQTCTNIAGSFNCSCLPGYSLDSDGVTCANVTVPPSCDTAGCGHICAEVAGNPQCYCRPGYKLAEDGQLCEDIQECDENLCSQLCDNTVGSFSCSCYEGFVLTADERSCDQCVPPQWGPDCGNTCNCNGRVLACDSVKGCICDAGWRGENCTENVDECTENPNLCDADKICEDTPGSYLCSCPPGYTKNGTACADIDECQAVISVCPQFSTCQNVEGSFTCTCNQGYRKAGNACEDILECNNGQAECEQQCVDVPGGYNCDCDLGYILALDRRSCSQFGEDPCQGQGDCTQICTVEGGQATCKCNRGYSLADDSKTCLDINECEDNAKNLCSDKGSCQNTVGSFVCACTVGQKLQNDERTCAACDANFWGLNCANECGCDALGSTGCNAVSGCQCKDGWRGDKCDQDIDECSTATCPANAVCRNNPGSFRCRCRTGFKLSSDESTCEDIDECATPTENTCEHNCNNTVGSYICSCRKGFVLQASGLCSDIDECTLQISDCSQLCRNTQGSFACECFEGYTVNKTDYRLCDQGASAVCTNLTDCDNCRKENGVDKCFCNPGYVLNGDGKTCDDVKECLEVPSRCSQGCNELAGSYQCTCEDGYNLAEDQTTCQECEAGKFGSGCSQTCTCNAENTESCNPVNGTCTCRSGVKGTNCTEDLLECTDTPNICGENGICKEEFGTYACTCEDGYIRSNGVCTPCDSTHYGTNCANTCVCDVTNTVSCDKVNGSCMCNAQWQGDTCMDDVNECVTLSPCTGANETCRNTNGSYACDCVVGYVKSPESMCVACSFGFHGDGCVTQCNCASGQFDSCDTVSGACTCKTGWTGLNCSENIDECSNTQDPVCTKDQEVCRDTPGSYNCDCEIGYTKNETNDCVVCDFGKYGNNCSQSCPCTLSTTASCDNMNGSCTCKGGWEGSDCATNINECAITVNPVCNASVTTLCRDTLGSYACECKDGFVLNAAGSCVDRDECQDGFLHNCTQVCNNTFGSYFCSCAAGYTGSGNECTAVYSSLLVNITLNTNRDVVINAGENTRQYKDLQNGIASEVDKIANQAIPDDRINIGTVVHQLRIGSVVALVELRLDGTRTTYNGTSLLAKVLYALSTTATINLNGAITPVIRISYDGMSTTSADACDIYKSLRTFADDEYCEIDGIGIPVAKKLQEDETNVPLIVGITVPIAIIVILVVAILVYICCCKKQKVHGSDRSEQREPVAFRSAFAGNLPTKGNFGATRYMMYSPHTMSETASHSSDERPYRSPTPKGRILEGRSDFLDMPAPDRTPFTSPRDPFNENDRSNFSWENMFNMLDPGRHGAFEVPRPNVSNMPHRAYKNEPSNRDSWA